MIYRFGPFELDERAGELRRAGQPVAIQPKPLALLLLLVRERQRVLSQDELFEALWPGTAVTSGSLTRAVSHARRAIDDTHKGSLLRSIPRRGYRFVADVQELGGETHTAGADGLPSAGSPTGPKSAAQVFVGRDAALRTLFDAWQQSQSGPGRMVLLEGAAGIGKTRLVEVFAQAATDRGALVLVGRARDGDGVPAFWLWSQVLRGLSDAGLADEGLAARGIADAGLRGPGRAVGADSFDALRSGAGDAEDSQQRFLFFDSVARALMNATSTRPLIIVLEDLQWVRSPSLRLLEHLSFELRDSRLLLIGTIRTQARKRSHPLNRTLSILREHERCESIELSGLSRGAVGALLSEVIGRPPPAELTSELFARTEGVPLFVREAVRLLDERGELKRPERIARRGITLPNHAVDLIRRSLSALSEECAEVVAAASILGREFTLPHVATVANIERGDALDRLDEAVAAGTIEEVTQAAATYRFTHALFQEAAYEALQPGNRARMHGRAAERLEAQHAGDRSAVIAELAHHHHESIAVGDPERAFACAIAAAEHARQNFAYEQAASHYEQAVDALEHLETVDPARRLETLIELSEAHRLAGDRARRRQVSARAMESARSLGWNREFAEAAIRFCDVSEWSPEDDDASAAVAEAMAGVDPGDLELRARLTARRAYLQIRTPNSRETAREAADLARHTGDPDTLQEVLYVLHYSIAGPDHLAERRGLIEELTAAAEESTSREPALIALLDIACDYLTLGDQSAAIAMRERAAGLCGSSPSPAMRWHTQVFDTGRALLEGRIQDVRQMTTDTLLLGRRIDHPYAQACFNAQRMQLYLYERDYEAIRPLFARAMSSNLGANHWARAIIARNELRLGEPARAREIWRDLAASNFGDIARSIRWIGTLVQIAHLCADLDDADRAETLIELLAPEEELHGVLPVPILYGGPASHCLARLNEVLGFADLAGEYYEHALESARRMHARPVQARIQQDWARLLARRGNTRRAESLEREGRSLAESLGCHL